MENESQSTPMVNVWMVVFCTMIATGLFGYVWHTMGMSEAHDADEKESLVVKDDIARLVVYRDQIKANMSSTSATTTQSTASTTTTGLKK